MITSDAQAIMVQGFRVINGKLGYSKAVRRYMKATNDFDLKDKLPVRWPIKELGE